MDIDAVDEQSTPRRGIACVRRGGVIDFGCMQAFFRELDGRHTLRLARNNSVSAAHVAPDAWAHLLVNVARVNGIEGYHLQRGEAFQLIDAVRGTNVPLWLYGNEWRGDTAYAILSAVTEYKSDTGGAWGVYTTPCSQRAVAGQIVARRIASRCDADRIGVAPPATGAIVCSERSLLARHIATSSVFASTPALAHVVSRLFALPARSIVTPY